MGCSAATRLAWALFVIFKPSVFNRADFQNRPNFIQPNYTNFSDRNDHLPPLPSYYPLLPTASLRLGKISIIIEDLLGNSVFFEPKLSTTPPLNLLQTPLFLTRPLEGNDLDAGALGGVVDKPRMFHIQDETPPSELAARFDPKNIDNVGWQRLDIFSLTKYDPPEAPQYHHSPFTLIVLMSGASLRSKTDRLFIEDLSRNDPFVE